MMYEFLECGRRFSSCSVGGSVASAKDANVSIIKLIHNIWIGFKTYCFMRPAPSKVTKTATMLTVSWNWMNFRIES